MTHKEKLSVVLTDLIDDCYTIRFNKLSSYDIFVKTHADIIDKISNVLHDVNEILPKQKMKVFAVQDLSPLGKGTFINQFWYTPEYGFVANEFDDDAYGYITKWVSFEEVDSL